jgi:DNA-binding transcriptional regulator YiaG
MTPAEFDEIKARLSLTDGQLAKWLGLSDPRAIRYYRSGERPISGPIARLMRAFDEGFVPPEFRD